MTTGHLWFIAICVAAVPMLGIGAAAYALRALRKRGALRYTSRTMLAFWVVCALILLFSRISRSPSIKTALAAATTMTWTLAGVAFSALFRRAGEIYVKDVILGFFAGMFMQMIVVAAVLAILWYTVGRVW